MNLAELAGRVGYQDPRRYEREAGFLFEGIAVAGKRVLDVGAGRGAFSVWAALQGAASVVALEPELDGSTAGSSVAFEQVVEDFGLSDRVELRRVPLEQLESRAEFDLVLMNGVINHLNEAAVVRLHRDPQAVDEYVETLRALRSLVRPGALAIVSDCGRRSIWNTVGRQGPWTHDISGTTISSHTRGSRSFDLRASSRTTSAGHRSRGPAD